MCKDFPGIRRPLLCRCNLLYSLEVISVFFKQSHRIQLVIAVKTRQNTQTESNWFWKILSYLSTQGESLYLHSIATTR